MKRATLIAAAGALCASGTVMAATVGVSVDLLAVSVDTGALANSPWAGMMNGDNVTVTYNITTPGTPRAGGGFDYDIDEASFRATWNGNSIGTTSASLTASIINDTDMIAGMTDNMNINNGANLPLAHSNWVMNQPSLSGPEATFLPTDVADDLVGGTYFPNQEPGFGWAVTGVFGFPEIAFFSRQSVSFIPAPGAAALLGLGGLAMIRRRR